MKQFEAAKTRRGRWALYHPNGCYDLMSKQRAKQRAAVLNKLIDDEQHQTVQELERELLDGE